MNKFMKTAVILLLLAGVSYTVFRASTKKAGDGSVTEVQQLNIQKDANGNLVDQDGNRVDDQGYRLEADGKRMLDKEGHEVAGMGTNAGTVGATSGNNGEHAGTSGQTNEAANGKTDSEETAGTAPKVKFGAPAEPKVEGSLSDKLNQPTFTQTKAESNCFSFEYKHEKEALNKDIEDFLDFSNAFPVFHDKVTEKSICVKVNDKPVPFKLSKYKNQKEILVGSVVGPEATIKVSYCVNTSKCKEACAVKSNRFMDDLMSDAGDEDEFKESWGDAKEQKKALQAGVKEFRKVASENKDLQKQSTIRSWDTVQKNEWVCNK